MHEGVLRVFYSVVGVSYWAGLEELELEEPGLVVVLPEVPVVVLPEVPVVEVDELVEVLPLEPVEGARPRFLEERTTSSRVAWSSGMPRKAARRPRGTEMPPPSA